MGKILRSVEKSCVSCGNSGEIISDFRREIKGANLKILWREEMEKPDALQNQCIGLCRYFCWRKIDI
jgi:hypothetical protein